MAARIKKGDKVVILSGRDKGRSGEVIKVMPAEERALVRCINMVTRHQRQMYAVLWYQAEVSNGGHDQFVRAGAVVQCTGQLSSDLALGRVGHRNL